jgi:hypothetical protein
MLQLCSPLETLKHEPMTGEAYLVHLNCKDMLPTSLCVLSDR